MIDKLSKDNAEEAEFTIEDARACGWHFPSSGMRPKTLEEIERDLAPKSLEHIERELRRGGSLLRAEKYTPGQGMTRFARRSEDALLEEIFQHERAIFEAERRHDPDALDAFTEATNEVVRAYNDQLDAVKGLSKAMIAEDGPAEVVHRGALKDARFRFFDASERASAAGQRAADELETNGADAGELRAALEDIKEDDLELMRLK